MQSWFVTLREKLEEADFVEEKFLQKRSTKLVFVWRIWCDTEDISKVDVAKGIVSQVLWIFDSIELKEMTKILQLCCSWISKLVLTFLFCFLFGFGEAEDLIFELFFLSNLPAFAVWSALVCRWALLLTLNRVTFFSANDWIFSCYITAIMDDVIPAIFCGFNGYYSRHCHWEKYICVVKSVI